MKITQDLLQRLHVRAATAAAPWGVYVCGNTSTGAGLTATVLRNGTSEGYCFTLRPHVSIACPHARYCML